MREAIRRPSRDGVLDCLFEVLSSPSKADLPKPRFSESVRLSSPSLILPQATCAFRRADLKTGVPARLGGTSAEKMTFQEAFKNRSNFDAFSTSIFERLGSVLEGQDGSQIDQKSIKIEFSSLSVSTSIFISIFHRFFFPTSTHWISKK